jgi:hypothetical protein
MCMCWNINAIIEKKHARCNSGGKKWNWLSYHNSNCMTNILNLPLTLVERKKWKTFY